MPRPYLAPGPDDDGAARRSLVLAGGGMRVAYQAGVLVALEQAGLKFHHVDGTSGGTINLSMVLSGLPVAEICSRWRTLNPRQFAAPLPMRTYLSSVHWPGLSGGRGLRDRVFPHLGIDPAAIRQAEGVTGTYNVANFASKSSEVIEHTSVDLDLLVAGVSLPVLMPGVGWQGATYADAVWIRDSNVPEAIRRGSEEVWLVWCIGNTPRYRSGLFRQYVHMIEMAATGSLLADLSRLATDPRGQRLRLHVIKPTFPLPLDPAYYFGRIDASALIDLGYQDALRYLHDPRPLTAPWSADVTSMQEPPPTVAARLTLEGPFALGFSEPQAGARAGEQHGTSLGANLRLEARRGAPMDVVGHVDIPGWPPGSLIEEGHAVIDRRIPGVIDLRCSTETGSFELRAEGCSGGLAVRLHEKGAEAAVGAGVVPFGWTQALSAIPTIQSINADSVAASWRAGIEMAGTVWRAASGCRRHA
jgi:predicted acylesterase/phospholipase RssA